MPFFSIIMPSYNRGNAISASIDSILCQTDSDFELIIVDDCSTDNTVEIINDKSKSDSRIRIFQTPNNSGGPAKPKNIGVKAARGVIILFCDQDDLYLPNKLAKLRYVFELYPETEILFSDYLLSNEERKSYRYLEMRDFKRRAANYLKYLKDDIYACPRFLGCMASGIDSGMATISIAVRKNTFDRLDYIFSERYRIVDDIDCWYRLAAIADVKYLDEALAIYNSRSDSVSAQRVLNAQESLDFHRINLARNLRYLMPEEIRMAKQLVSRMAYRNAVIIYETPRKCFKLSWESLSYAFSFLAFKLLIESFIRMILIPRKKP